VKRALVGVDSSGWNEVFQWVLREHGEAQAVQAAPHGR
jgi:hypothetical protein